MTKSFGNDNPVYSDYEKARIQTIPSSKELGSANVLVKSKGNLK